MKVKGKRKIRKTHDMSLKGLLSLAFGSMFVLLLVLGMVSIGYIKTISKDTQVLYNRPHTNLVGMWEVKTMIAQTGNGLREGALGGSELSPELKNNLSTAVSKMEAIEENKVDKTQPRSDNMIQILNAIEEWSKVGTELSNKLINKTPISIEEAKQYNSIEQQAIEEIDSIIETASDNALNFKNSAQKDAATSIAIMIFIFIVSIIVTMLLLKFVLNRITVPIKELLKAAKEIESGHLDGEVLYYSKSELGILAENFRQMQDIIHTVVVDISENLNKMSDGDFCINTETNYIGDFSVIKDSLEKISERLSHTLRQVDTTASQVAAESEQVANGAQSLSQGTTEQASSVQQLSATISDISKHVKQNASLSEKTNDMAELVMKEVTESNSRMQNMVLAMSDISKCSEEIGKIIKTIEDIAFQTNILALNAAVEAARAGAAGKGFAVVADEVRNLAGKSAEASKNTSYLIENTLKAVENGTTISDETANSLLKVVDGVREVSSTISKITDASKEQASAISQVTLGIEQIAGVIHSNSASAEQSAAASQELSGQAQQLKDLVRKFRY